MSQNNKNIFVLLFYLCSLVWVLFLIDTSLEWTDTRDRLLPLITTSFLLILLMIQASRHSFYLIDSNNVSLIFQNDIFSGRKRNPLIISGTVILLVITIYYIGIILSMVIYIFIMISYLTENIRKAITTSVLSTIIIVAIFEYLLGTRLWTGVLLP